MGDGLQYLRESPQESTTFNMMSIFKQNGGAGVFLRSPLEGESGNSNLENQNLNSNDKEQKRNPLEDSI